MSKRQLASEEFPALPTAHLDVEGCVPLTTLEKIADAHAHDLWGKEIARGQPFPVVDEAGDIFAYVFPYIRGSHHFPEYRKVFERVRNLKARYEEVSKADEEKRIEYLAESRELTSQFGSVYVSATRTNFPVLRASHFLHPYFLSGEVGQEEAKYHLNQKKAKLERIFFLGPHEEYFEFVSQKERVLIHVDSLAKKSSKEIMSIALPSPVSPEILEQIENAWDQALDRTPVGIDADDVSRMHTKKLIPNWELIPVVNWTWWCVPTAYTMVLGFWDNFVKGKGTILGYGRLIDFWFEHPKFSGNNVPSIMDEMIDPKTGTWRAGFKNFEDFINKTYGYNFSHDKTTATPSNDWAWNTLKGEIDSGRPAVWSVTTPNHAMTAFGYRVNSNGKFAIVYNTWGTTAQQQLDEWNYTLCKGIGRLFPKGGTNGDHLIIVSPDGGETIYTHVPHEISWFVWGNKIKKTTLSFSEDGGNKWTPIAKDLHTESGWNSYVWLSGKTATRGRIRVQGYTKANEYIAGDGSQLNFCIKKAPLINTAGKIKLLRVHDLGTGFGPPTEFMDSEVIVRLQSDMNRTLGFQLRPGPFLSERKKMFSILRDAYCEEKVVTIDYVQTGNKTGIILRVWIKK